MELIVLAIVIAILFIIGKNYKTEEFKNINLKQKEIFRGDLLNHEAGLLVALMAKVAKADGKVGELEAEIIKHTFISIFSFSSVFKSSFISFINSSFISINSYSLLNFFKISTK